MQLSKLIQWQTNESRAVTAHGITIRPLSQALIIQLPWGSFVWNRPAALLVDWDGRTEQIPIIDVTRRVQWGLWGLLALVLLISWRRKT